MKIYPNCRLHIGISSLREPQATDKAQSEKCRLREPQSTGSSAV